MTRQEMSKLFAPMMMIWPDAAMFRGGTEHLEKQVNLWTACMQDIDFYLANRAMIMLCQECRYPPTPADLRSKAVKLHQDIEETITESIAMTKLFVSMAEESGMPLDAACGTLPQRLKKVVAAMGGPDNLRPRGTWNFDGFRSAYWSLLKNEPQLGEAKSHHLGKKTNGVMLDEIHTKKKPESP